MRQRSVQTRAGSLTAAAVLAIGLGASAAQAGFVLDLKLTGGGTSTSVGTGTVVSLDVFGTVTGTGAAAEGLQDAFFGVTNSGTVGSLSTVTLASPFNGVATDVSPNVTTSSGGTLYGPVGGKSVGSTDSTAADGWVFARSTSMTTVTDGVPVKLGSLTFTAGNAAGSTTLAINGRQAVNSLVIPALWQEDGVGKDGVATIGTSVSITVTAAPVHNPGDTNNDGVVDLVDLNNVLNNFGASGSNPGDDNSDGVVDLVDLNAVLNNFGTSYAASALAVVPEPASLSLIGLGAAALVGRRRRR